MPQTSAVPRYNTEHYRWRLATSQTPDNHGMNAEPANTRFENGSISAPARLCQTLGDSNGKGHGATVRLVAFPSHVLAVLDGDVRQVHVVESRRYCWIRTASHRGGVFVMPYSLGHARLRNVHSHNADRVLASPIA